MRIAALDLGTNSFHLLAVDAHADGSFVPLLKEKEMLRLGEWLVREGRLPDALADEAVETAHRLCSLAASAGCEEILMCATSALREAENGSEVVQRIEDATGLAVRVINGRDEARLTFAAVRASISLPPRPVVCFDLGGGSLEVMVGDGAGLVWSTSVKLGVGRLSAELVRNDPPTKGDRRRLRDRIRDVLGPVADAVADFEPEMAIGSSGTFCALARMIGAARAGGTAPLSVNQFTVSRAELSALDEQVFALDADGRRRLPGLEARRVDLIPAGAAIAVEATKLFSFASLTVSEWALREGMVLEAIGRHDVVEWSGDPGPMRRAAVEGLARRCQWNEGHARQVAALAAELFDQTRPLHGLTTGDRELLECAGLLHDIGEHVSAIAHHKHTAYLIQHGRLRGFSPDEVLVLAALARYHRNSEPKPAHEPFGSLSPIDQERVTKLASILRLADGLDRGHCGAVEDLVVDVTSDSVRLTLEGRSDVDLELWGARRKRALFERLFGRRVDVVTRQP
ncbi:MAG: exopolyphosphatase / guanosine-5-triphosphate,3-diphosphate pyrophosphatase [Actinomycetota bacterium]|jgi:exopolyphosphatase/guanosine-5'-triphosphate,3'-diphosphate pyrophosphatase